MSEEKKRIYKSLLTSAPTWLTEQERFARVVARDEKMLQPVDELQKLLYE